MFNGSTERRRYLAFDTLAWKLKEIPAERWQHSDNVVARVNLPNMQSWLRSLSPTLEAPTTLVAAF